MYNFIFARTRPPILNALLDKKTHNADYYARRDGNAELLRQQVHVCYTMQSERGETLQGNYYPCGTKFGKR